MKRSNLLKLATATVLVAFSVGNASAASVKLGSPEWLGNLSLEKKTLESVAEAFRKALTAPVDAAQQCGKAVQDCEVRAAREWEYNGTKYREMVIYIHTKGHASRAVKQENGKWPAVAAN